MRKSVAASLILLLALGLYGCGGGKSSEGTDPVEPAEEPAQEAVEETPEEPAEELTEETVYVVLGDDAVETYRHRVWAEVFQDGEWQTADGVTAAGVLADVADKLPVVEIGPDDSLSFRAPESVELKSVDVYDAEYALLQDDVAVDEFLAQVGSLEAGTYYVAAYAVQTGEYIESEDKHNQYGDEYLFTLAVGAAE